VVVRQAIDFMEIAGELSVGNFDLRAKSGLRVTTD
jgi:hypothetical protein